MVHEERLSEKIYIVSELAKTDLLEYLEVKGALRESVVRRLFYDLASGVNYMHTENVAHRDIKWLVKIARSNSGIRIGFCVRSNSGKKPKIARIHPKNRLF